jgi:hypothetical protein
MSSSTKSFTAVGNGPELAAKRGDTLGYSLSGTFVATVVLEEFVQGTWVTVVTLSAAASSSLAVEPRGNAGQARFRLRCSAYTSGTVVTTLDVQRTPTSSAGRAVVPFYQVTRVLTNDEIKALPGAALEVVAAAGPTRVVVPLGMGVAIDPSGGAYTNVTGATWGLNYSNGGQGASSLVPVASCLGATSAGFAWVGGAPGGNGAGSVLDLLTSSIAVLVDGALGSGVKLRDDYGAGAYTAGHANNSATVTVVYAIFNVVTGRFE